MSARLTVPLIGSLLEGGYGAPDFHLPYPPAYPQNPQTALQLPGGLFTDKLTGMRRAS